MAYATEKKADPGKGGTSPSPQLESRKRRFEKLRADRGTLNSHLEEIAEVIYPNGLGFVSRRTAGEKRMSRIFDETGVTANRLLSASMHSMATNPASKWFSIRVLGGKTQDGQDINDSPAVKKWCSDTENILYEEMYAPGTNLIPTLHEFYLGLGAFGTGVIFIGEASAGNLMFQARSLAECHIAENRDGVIDTLYRCYRLTVRQVMEAEADGWSPSDKTREMFQQGKLDDEIEIIHCVEPRTVRLVGKKNARNMPWASCYFELATCHELAEGGFPEFPFVCPRWEKAAGEIYGRSPGMEALPAVRMLQSIESETIKIMQKLSNPPYFLRDDGVLGAIRNIPGATNFWRGNPNEGVMQLPTSDKIPITLEWVEGIRNRVRTIFQNDTLQIVDDREMTLGEANMRRTERMRLQGPNIGRLDAEMLGPMITRVYGILDRKGKIPLAPEEMIDPSKGQSRPITVEFVSPLANVQKQEQLAGLVQIFNYIAPLGELGLMALAKKINMNRVIDGLWDILANDPDWLNTPEEMQAIEQQEAQAKNIQAAEPIAGAAEQGTQSVKNLADAQAGGGIDMQQLMALVGQGVGQAAQQQRRAA